MPKKSQKQNDKENLLNQAQDLVYDAFEASSAKEAKALALNALLLSSDCADAYTVLADCLTENAYKLPLLFAAVEAGERSIGAKDFEFMKGSFWGFIETRPYMRALLQLAICFDDMGEYARAIECYRKMLDLNPNDNQGVRFLLMPLLVISDMYKDAEKLYSDFQDDSTSHWQYNRLLLNIHLHGATAEAGVNLHDALKCNVYIASALITKKKQVPSKTGYYSLGSKEEAAEYIQFNRRAWEHVPGAIEWLKSAIK